MTDPEYTTRRVLMTPDRAAKLLAFNDHNRPLNQRRAQQYAMIMKEGKWDLKNPLGCTTCVAPNGRLLDSQHRLQAIVQSGVSIPWVLHENVNPRAQASMDGGRARTPGDFLGANGFSNANRIAAIAKLIYSLDKKSYEATPTREELLKVAKTFLEEITWAISELGKASAPVFAAYAWALGNVPNHSSEIEVMARQVRTGDGCVTASRFVRRIAGFESGKTAADVEFKKNTQIDRWKSAILVLRCIEAFMLDEDMVKMPYVKERDQQERLLLRLRKMAKVSDQAAE